MPLYEYKCGKCGQVFELRQNFSDAPLTHHEGCGGAVEKVLSAPALQFKGTGWYVTDYARGGGARSSDSSRSDSKSESKSDSKSESKSDSKSESKSDSKPASGSSSSNT